MAQIPVNTLESDWLKAQLRVALALLLLGILYVGQAWSPSSYGHVLQLAGASETGVVWGQPRAIRSDEWSVTTPLTQATVRNNFERYNQTSYYGEDLRSNYALPLHDWGMVFKPSFWLYGLVPAAYAFSWHYWVMLVAFTFGYAHFFRLTGATATQAFLLSVSLYFTGFVQFFWNSNTSLFAYFPWLLVAMTAPWRLGARVLFFYWVATCWLIGNFYPPLFISLALVAAVFLWAYRPEVLQRQSLLMFGLATLAACGTAVFYLWDYLLQTASTSYPGQRVSTSGYYPWHLFLTHLWPSALFDHDFNASVNYTNVTGVGVAGLYWTLAASCFTRWSRNGLRKLAADRAQRILLFGLAVVMAWMMAPVPDWLGKITLLNRVPPERMVYAAGLLLILNVWHASLRLGVAPDRWLARASIYLAMVLAAWLSFGFWTQPLSGPEQHLTEWLAPVLLCIALWWAFKRSWNPATVLLTACALAQILVFGRFNPIQSALPIFEEPRHALAQTLQKYVDPNGVLPVQKKDLIGASLNGMGFKAVAHLNVTPQWSVWQSLLGPLDDQAKSIFNRYGHVRLVASNQAKLLENDQIGVPASLFRPQPSAVLSSHAPADARGQGGQIEHIEKLGSAWILTGWAAWSGARQDRELWVVTDGHHPLTRRIDFIADQERWDRVALTQDPNQLLSGFVMSIHTQDGETLPAPRCVFSRTGTGDVWKRLEVPGERPSCGPAASTER